MVSVMDFLDWKINVNKTVKSSVNLRSQWPDNIFVFLFICIHVFTVKAPPLHSSLSLHTADQRDGEKGHGIFPFCNFQREVFHHHLFLWKKSLLKCIVYVKRQNKALFNQWLCFITTTTNMFHNTPYPPDANASELSLKSHWSFVDLIKSSERVVLKVYRDNHAPGPRRSVLLWFTVLKTT